MRICNFHFAWAALTVAIALSAHGAPGTNDSEQVIEKPRSVESEIIPPAGTDKSEVDRIYGIPEEILHGVRGSTNDYPMHIYQLLPPRKNEEFRAVLYITYREGKVWRAGINHISVLKGRVGYFPGSLSGPEEERYRKEIERENLQVIADLKEIQAKFEEPLKSAEWNTKESSK
jgi:hypothetical protein